MPLVQTRGAASAQGFGEFAQATVANYIEDVFSTYLYTGNGSTGQTITNSIDLSTKGGLVWGKSRSNATDNSLVDTVRGNESIIYSNLTQAADTPIANTISFLSTGFSVKNNILNANGHTYASWTFRKQPKFFDVVTYTGNGTNRTIAHNLGSVPGSIIVKRTDTTAAWAVYHRSLANTEYLVLNSTAAKATGATWWNSTTPTSAVFSVGTDASVNASGGTYVAYLFAHDAGGFGLTGTDNVISCGSFTSDGSGSATVSLGYEPQWVMIKRSDASDDWIMLDVMRGMSFSNCLKLAANASSAEYNFGANQIFPTATGFIVNGTLSASATYIYIAIRRGPMKVPTLGTSVFSPNVVNAPLATKTTVGFPIDLQIFNYLPGDGGNSPVLTRLAGVSTNSTSSGSLLTTSSTAAESSASGFCLGWDNTGFQMPSGYTNSNVVFYNFGRAPGFFDVVCYTGNGTAGRAVAHNLAAVPEFMIIKYRNDVQSWFVFHSFGTSIYRRQFLNLTDSTGGSGDYSYGSGGMYQKPDATNFYLEAVNANQSGGTFVAYLFATVSGVSKVFSYTGNGSSQTINCGFTGGSRFVMIKRTDAAGDWYVWDSARGIVAGNDPHLSLNTTAAEVTTDDSVDTDNTGFIVNQVAATNVNVSSATYIGLAIA
jgi:hypothetical protein